MTFMRDGTFIVATMSVQKIQKGSMAETFIAFQSHRCLAPVVRILEAAGYCWQHLFRQSF